MDQCKQEVYGSDKWDAFHPHRCTRKVWADGFCKQHHPITVKARDDKAQKNYHQKLTAMLQKQKAYPETHFQGMISIEQSLQAGGIRGDLGIQIAEDGRIWVCIDGVAFLRFKPILKGGV